MIWLLSAAGGGGNQEGASAPSWTLPGTGGRGSPVGCLLLLRVPAIRLASERLRWGRGRRGGRTGEGRLMGIRTEENGNFTFSKPCPIDEIVGAWYAI